MLAHTDSRGYDEQRNADPEAMTDSSMMTAPAWYGMDLTDVNTGTTSKVPDLICGNQFLNPSSAPVLIIDRPGQAHPLPCGVKRAQALQEALGLYLK